VGAPLTIENRYMKTINTKGNWDQKTKKQQHGDRPTSTLNLSSELN
jgi:hypothetical protein